MRRRTSCAICLLTLLWVCFPTPPTSGQLLTEDEVDSMIPSDRSYAGSEVRALVKGIVTTARTEIRTAAADAVKEAVIPLQAELAGERVRGDRWEAAWREERAERIRAEGLAKWGVVIGGLGLLFTAGVALGAAAF